MAMTREEQLWSMTMTNLVSVADKLGIKVDKKGAKAKAIEKIIAAEEMNKQNEKELAKEEKEITKDHAAEEEFNKKHPTVPVKPVKAPENPKANKTTKEPKKANLKLSELTYKGETKSIRTWAEELNMPWATLYDRVNRNGWPVDLAIETPLGQRRSKKA